MKSRYVLQDCKHNRPADGGELFAATPSLLSVRTALTLSSRDMAAGKKQLLIFGDVTQAFPHAPLDRPVWTRLLSDCEGLETVIDGEAVTVHAATRWSSRERCTGIVAARSCGRVGSRKW